MPLSTFLNGQAPSQLRGLQWLALSDVATVLTSTYTSDSGGGASQAWGTVASGVPCRIDPLSALGRDVLGGRIDERSTHLVTVPTSSSVSTDQRIAIAGRGTFEVTATRTQTSEQVSSFEVIEISD